MLTEECVMLTEDYEQHGQLHACNALDSQCRLLPLSLVVVTQPSPCGKDT